MGTAIRARGLTKRYGRVRALDGMDLDVAPGRVHGLLGPNGAGKSTTIRVLLGQVRPRRGEVEVLGLHPRRRAVALHRRLAYVPADVSLWPNLTGGEAVDLLLRLRGVHGARARADRARLADAFDLDLSRRCRAYSTGNRQKVALVAAFAGEAELLILDEPTAGLDPLMELVFQDQVRAARDRGAAVLLSSHVLGQVEALVDDVSIVRDGRRLDHGTLDELRHLSRTRVTVTTRAPMGSFVTAVPGLEVVTLAEDGMRLEADVEAGALDALVNALGPLRVTSLVSRPPTLEQLLLGYYRRDAAGPAA